MGGNPWNRSNRLNRKQRARDPPAERILVLPHLPCRQRSTNGLPHEPTNTTNDASVEAPLMTGFKRSRKSSDIRKLGMLTCRIVVDTPMRSKTDSEATQALKCYHVPHSPLAPSFATLLE